MTPPSLGRIHDDDRLLDALGGRRTPAQDEPLTELFGSWVAEIDTTSGAVAPTRRRGPRLRHLGAAAGVTLATLSVSSMAAAVTGHEVPVLYQLGSVASNVFGGAPSAAERGLSKTDGISHAPDRSNSGVTRGERSAGTAPRPSASDLPSRLPASGPGQTVRGVPRGSTSPGAPWRAPQPVPPRAERQPAQSAPGAPTTTPSERPSSTPAPSTTSPSTTSPAPTHPAPSTRPTPTTPTSPTTELTPSSASASGSPTASGSSGTPQPSGSTTPPANQGEQPSSNLSDVLEGESRNQLVRGARPAAGQAPGAQPYEGAQPEDGVQSEDGVQPEDGPEPEDGVQPELAERPQERRSADPTDTSEPAPTDTGTQP